MVMRNRHDGSSPSGWWDDLPPKIRDRFGSQPIEDVPFIDYEAPASERVSSPPGPSHRKWISEYTRLGLVFLAVAIGNILFLLIALSFLTGAPGALVIAPNR